MDWRAKLKALIDSPDEDETADAPAEVVADAAVDPTEVQAATAADDPSENPEPVGLGEDPSTEPDSNPADPNADPEADPTVDPTPTLPEPTGLTDDERDGMNVLAAENEALRSEVENLRNRVAELGGDAALGIVEEVVEDVPADEPEYDADADFAKENDEIARLKGDKTKEDE